MHAYIQPCTAYCLLQTAKQRLLDFCGGPQTVLLLLPSNGSCWQCLFYDSTAVCTAEHPKSCLNTDTPTQVHPCPHPQSRDSQPRLYQTLNHCLQHTRTPLLRSQPLGLAQHLSCLLAIVALPLTNLICSACVTLQVDLNLQYRQRRCKQFQCRVQEVACQFSMAMSAFFADFLDQFNLQPH